MYPELITIDNFKIKMYPELITIDELILIGKFFHFRQFCHSSLRLSLLD